MKIVSIGREIKSPYVETITFSSSKTILDYDVLIWHPNHAFYEYAPGNSFKQVAISMTANSYKNFVNQFNKRIEEIEYFISLGRTVILFTPTDQYVYSDNKTQFNILSNLSLFRSGLNTSLASGNSIEMYSNCPHKDFLKKTILFYLYEAIIQGPIGEPLLKIKGTDKSVASSYKIGDANIFLLPWVDSKYHADFIEYLCDLIKSFNKKEAKVFEHPEWASRLLVPDEKESINKLASLNEELSLLQEKIEKQKDIVGEIDNNKILFTGSGTDLEIQVQKIFEQLGFEILPSESGRTDLIIKYNQKIAVVEIKGVSKSAAEKNAAQLEKWVSEYNLQYGILPKGILLINAFKEISLEKRTEETFPNQMLKYSVGREHCLISGTQLLCLFYDVIKTPENREKLIESLFSTNGVWNKYKWDDFIKIENLPS